MIDDKIKQLSLSIYKWLKLSENKHKQEKLLLVIIELCIYDFITFFIVFVAGFLFGYGLETIIFIVFFSWIRQYSGGYHADTHFKCISSYFVLYLLFLTMLYYSELSNNVHITISIISCVYIIYNAPVQHCNQPLTPIEKKDNRNKAIQIVSVVMFLQIILYILKSNLLIILTIVLFYSALLMIIQKRSKNYRSNDI